jgi:lysozyme
MIKTKSRLKGSATVMALAIVLVGTWEGLRTVAYKDIVGVPTVCFGETRGVKMGDKYSVEECKTMLGDGLIEFELGMQKCLTNPAKIPDKPYVAFLSLAYNIGNGAFCKSSIVRKANAGDIRGACNAIPLYNKAGGKVVKGLVRRRADEQRLCLEGIRA